MKGLSTYCEIRMASHGDRMHSAVVVRNPVIARRTLTVNALWDTGATVSIMARSIAEKLGLRYEPISFNVSGAFSGCTSSLSGAIAQLCIGAAPIPLPVAVVDDKDMMPGLPRLVLGMTFINLGDLHVYHEGTTVKGVFIYPPLPSIDFIGLAKEAGRTPATDLFDAQF